MRLQWKKIIILRGPKWIVMLSQRKKQTSKHQPDFQNMGDTLWPLKGASAVLSGITTLSVTSNDSVTGTAEEEGS